MRLLQGVSFALGIAVLLFVGNAGDVAAQATGKKTGAKAKSKKNIPPSDQPSVPPASKKKPPSPWEEYLAFAPDLSMDVDDYTAKFNFSNTDVSGQPTKPETPHDARLRKALATVDAAKQDEKRGVDRAAGKKMTPAEKAAYDRGIKILADKAVSGDPQSQVEGLAGALMALGSLQKQSSDGGRRQEAARLSQKKAWEQIIEIPQANAGPAATASPFKFEVVVGPIRNRALRVTNVSGTDLKSVTMHLQTWLSPGEEDYYLYFPSWKKGESRSFSRSLVSKTMDVQAPMPFKSAFRYSVWCPELTMEGVTLHIPLQRPHVEGTPQLYATYFLCAPEVAKK